MDVAVGIADLDDAAGVFEDGEERLAEEAELAAAAAQAEAEAAKAAEETAAEEAPAEA